ncbi:hypothetical protein POTOM_037198 [Populus tomentosa]|uniref:Uncharacterized protein n=1 Tax=Populus tomentosa TaxID=118781 RepID=A0A8X7YTF3_POPTO|nr:hypothetical protein POTOM_037198 [Populus tomentosa]
MSVTAEVLAKFWLAQQRDTGSGAPLSNSPLFVRPMFANTTKRARMMVVCRCSVGDQIFSVRPSTNYEFDYLGQSTKGDLNLNFDHLDTFGMDGPATLQGPIEEVAMKEAEEAEDLLNDLGISSPSSARNSSRGIFCSRTLNLRSISAIGYDMDYTLIHYNVKAWEGRAYDYCLGNLRSMGFPVDGLAFDPDLVIRGLVIDKEKGNLVKAGRFGYVKRAMHGTRMLSTQDVSEMYGRELVDLRKENRWVFLNTLFSVSEAVAYMQLELILHVKKGQNAVSLFEGGPTSSTSVIVIATLIVFYEPSNSLYDEGAISAEICPPDYRGLNKACFALFRAHVEGQLKSEIMSKPELFVEPDPELPLALLDQKEAGKKLLLVTNSDYHFTDKMMKHSFNRFLPNDMGWRDLFDIVIISARKPEFFQMSHPLYEVVTGEGLMRPCFKACKGGLCFVHVLVLSLSQCILYGGLYSGGSAQMVENSLDIHGDETLYVGDHIYTDVSQSKVHQLWRTALICQELEEEHNALIHSRGHRATLIELINQKEVVGDLFNQLRLALQRRNTGRPAQTLAATNMDDQELTESMKKLLIVMQRLDEKIAPMLEANGELFNKRYADIYTSRVSNFLHYTPFMFFRSQEQTLAHDSHSYYQTQINGSAVDSQC